eukprot:g21896.t1
MLETIGVDSIDSLFQQVPGRFQLDRPLDLPPALCEPELEAETRALAARNANSATHTCFLGGGVYDHFVPAAVDEIAGRNEFYTAYTPYQAEASQGSLQAFFEYQTLICQLTDMDVSNASLYEGGTAVSEAAFMAMRVTRRHEKIVILGSVHPEYRQVLHTYLNNLNCELVVVETPDGSATPEAVESAVDQKTACLIVQHPNFYGCLEEAREFTDIAHRAGALSVISFDPISVGVLKSPGECGADIAVAEGQSLGIPMQYGGPYLGIMACREKFVRKMPGRLVGKTVDRNGKSCFVLNLQAREQHIRRDKATSNICTNQGLLALRATAYLSLVGPQGLKEVADLSCRKAHYLAEQLCQLDQFEMMFDQPFFKEFTLRCSETADAVIHKAAAAGFATRLLSELSAPGRRAAMLPACDVPVDSAADVLPSDQLADAPPELPELGEPDVIRHFVNLSTLNMSVDTHFYPLGSCTMKYNPKRHERLAGLPGLVDLHPYLPDEHIQGMLKIMSSMQDMLAEISGLPAVSLQPAAGAQGEFAALLVAAAYFRDKGEKRTKVIFPCSAHGTNPASAALAGFDCVQLDKSETGLVDLKELQSKLDDQTAVFMITNPNTLGLFEQQIDEISGMLHDVGGLVYIDGANMNAILGVTRPGDFGGDMMHYNVHKTFTGPHGAGGPGAGPIAVREFLADYLPGPVVTSSTGDDGEETFSLTTPSKTVGRVRSHFGNVGILLRGYFYLRTLGAAGLRAVSEDAVLNANYVKSRLQDILPVPNGEYCMHEFVASAKKLHTETGISTMDIAKRLLDFGFHAPTVYFPLVVPEAMMIEPTETESKDTLDRFVDVIHEIVEEDPDFLHNAPHTTPVSRPDEVAAARQPILKWTDAV